MDWLDAVEDEDVFAVKLFALRVALEAAGCTSGAFNDCTSAAVASKIVNPFVSNPGGYIANGKNSRNRRAQPIVAFRNDLPPWRTKAG